MFRARLRRPLLPPVRAASAHIKPRVAERMEIREMESLRALPTGFQPGMRIATQRKDLKMKALTNLAAGALSIGLAIALGPCVASARDSQNTDQTQTPAAAQSGSQTGSTDQGNQQGQGQEQNRPTLGGNGQAQPG